MLPPNARLERLVDATSEPLTVAEAKAYLRLEVSDDDALVGDLITAARLVVEGMLDRSLITTTWKLTLDALPLAAIGGVLGPALFGFGAGLSASRRALDAGTLTLPMPPLIGLTSLSYVDSGGTTRTLDPATDVIVSPGTPGRIAAAYGTFFPLARPAIASVQVVYTAGYGPTAADVPGNIRTALRLLVGHYYEHRSSQAEIPDAVNNLLMPSMWGAYA